MAVRSREERMEQRERHYKQKKEQHSREEESVQSYDSWLQRKVRAPLPQATVCNFNLI